MGYGLAMSQGAIHALSSRYSREKAISDQCETDAMIFRDARFHTVGKRIQGVGICGKPEKVFLFVDANRPALTRTTRIESLKP